MDDKINLAGRGGTIFTNATQIPHQYKYQGQELQDELGLNWDSFKYRNYDYAIGRFMSIDPFAEQYSYQSPYNFSENRVVDAWELEGKEAKIISEKQVEWRVKFQNSFSDSVDHLSTEQIQSTLAEVSAILSQNGVEVIIINDPNATYTIDANYPSAVVNPETGELEGFVNGQAEGNTQTGTVRTDGTAHTIAHEMGHTAGLPHSFESNSGVPNNEANKENLMNSGENPNVDLRSSTGTDLQPSQTQQMMNTIKNDTTALDMCGIEID